MPKNGVADNSLYIPTPKIVIQLPFIHIPEEKRGESHGQVPDNPENFRGKCSDLKRHHKKYSPKVKPSFHATNSYKQKTCAEPYSSKDYLRKEKHVDEALVNGHSSRNKMHVRKKV